MKSFKIIARILVGLVFIFSGFVKGIDPLGTAFRMEDYFIVFGMPWAIPFTLILSIFLCTLEFSLGISLFFNLWIRRTAWILLPMMIFFTVLTFFDARYNIVPDCGCFGDALKLTNLQTFLKNVALMLLVVPIFIFRNKYRGWAPVPGQIIILLIFAGLFGGTSLYAYRHLPLIDFMSWKTGNKVSQQNFLPVKFYLTYQNKETGESKEYLSPNYPWNDSVWMTKWGFKSQRIEDPNVAQGAALRIENESGDDITGYILDNPGLHFILVSYDLQKANLKAFAEIRTFYDKAEADSLSFVCLTNALPAEVKRFRRDHALAFEFYYADDVILKTMVRANPGLILMKNGVVLAKWHYNDFPEYEAVRKKFR